MTELSFTKKLARADEHLKAVDGAIIEFLATRPYEIITQRAGNEISARVSIGISRPTGCPCS
jgi:hypothetical protein